MCTGLRYLVMLLRAVFYLWQERTTPGRIALLMAFFGAVIYYFTDTRIGLAIVLLDAMICCWCIMVRKRNRLLLRVFE